MGNLSHIVICFTVWNRAGRLNRPRRRMCGNYELVAPGHCAIYLPIRTLFLLP
jgi:hypothetical protein